MTAENSFEKYKSLFDKLAAIIHETEQRITAETPDDFFVRNVNFFVKSFLIDICTYLESFLKESAISYVAEIKIRINNAQIPKNIVHWSIKKDTFKDAEGFDFFELFIADKDINDKLSGNIDKTIKLFKAIGVDIEAGVGFNTHKDVISTIVTKRNNIIHHNDSASDITMGDLSGYIGVVLLYIESIHFTSTSLLS